MPMFNPLMNISSSSKNNIQVGVEGLSLELELREAYSPLDLSSATQKKIILKKPNETVLTKDAIFKTDGTDGIIYYEVITGDLDQAGNYSVQAYIVLGDFSGYSTISTFTVYENLQ
jgi:hypothetical protein